MCEFCPSVAGGYCCVCGTTIVIGSPPQTAVDAVARLKAKGLVPESSTTEVASCLEPEDDGSK